MPLHQEWLTLLHVDQLGPATFNKLLNSFGTVEAILNASRNKLQAVGVSKLVIEGILEPNEEAIDQDLEWLQHDAHHLITIEDLTQSC